MTSGSRTAGSLAAVDDQRSLTTPAGRCRWNSGRWPLSMEQRSLAAVAGRR